MKLVKIYSTALIGSSEPIEMFRFSKNQDKVKQIINTDLIGNIDLSWLKAASKVYKISEDINDYVVVPNPIITADVPNRNSQAMDLQDLIEFDLERRRPRYKTFIGTPTFQEHNNKNNEKAKGVNLDASIVSVPKYGLAKVIVLSAFDRTKDKDLVNELIRNKTNNSFSMGATAPYFKCSICGGLLGPSINRSCTCRDLDYNDLRGYGKIVKGKVSYLSAKEFIFFENSTVSVPADSFANSNNLM